ncbi:hypothetical protein KBT16_02585 [Nostoc sp. CCCryo 231-06]|nr:hypothetical protein [Nostoc sp. CCCryo 231-06]
MPVEQRHKLLLEMSDDDIDDSDIPALNEKILNRAVIFRHQQNRRHKKGIFPRSYVILAVSYKEQKLYSRNSRVGKLVKISR